MMTRQLAAPECLITLVSASWATRYAARSSPGSRSRGSPRTSSVTLIPAAVTDSASAGRSASAWAGSRSAGTSSSTRSTPSRARISRSAPRLISSIEVSARAASAGCDSATQPATPACTAIRLRPCATTSCSSLAIRIRSSRSSWLRTALAYARCCATAYPISQAPATSAPFSASAVRASRPGKAAAAAASAASVPPSSAMASRRGNRPGIR